MTLWILIASILAPTGLAVACVWAYRKWQDRQGRTLPTSGKRIYGAGEQLRKRIEDETDKMYMGLTVLFFIGPYFVAAWALPKVDFSTHNITSSDWILAIGFAAMAAWAIRTIIRHGSARRRALAGLKAELYTAQELNHLIGDGCTVLHDVPGDGFNLDHVVIGPSAVYVVETKSVRKPRNTGKQDHYKVRQEGEVLHFPDFFNGSSIAQARRQAQWLTKFLKETLNQNVSVMATVSLPGWFIEGPISNQPGAVRVFSPAGNGAKFMAERRGRSFDQATIGLLTQALLLRYPVAD
jgi:hypothetical protein